MHEEKENTSYRILSTALECLSQRGYANVSMRDIAKEAGVALSQLNYYYKSKEGLFAEVVNQMTYRYIKEIENRLTAEHNPENKFSTLVSYFKELIHEKPEQLKLFYDFSAQALWNPLFAGQLNQLFKSIVNLIEKELLTVDVKIRIEKGFTGYSAGSAARLIFGALYGTSIQIMLDTEHEGDMEALNFADALFGQ